MGIFQKWLCYGFRAILTNVLYYHFDGNTVICPHSLLLYAKLKYIAAGHTPDPPKQLFGLPDISDFGDERTMPLHDVPPLSTVDQLPTAIEGIAQLLTTALPL